MDKLRALEYFLACAHRGSFTRAAQQLDVSVPAVAKLVTVLERELGATLFHRSAQGLSLTASGELYLDTCRPLLAQLVAADDLVADKGRRARGSLVIGAHAELLMMPWLSQFHIRYPEIQINVRTITGTTIKNVAAEVYVLHGWPDHPDMVLRRFAQTRLLTCAAPSYWAERGIPKTPLELEQHVCLLYRNDEGTVNDLWQYVRGEERLSILVRGWLVSDHRNLTIHAALSGQGVIRASDLLVDEHLRSGRLVQVLADWEMADAPPFNLLYAANQRRNSRVRLLIDYVIETFGQLEVERGDGAQRRTFAEPPIWKRGKYRHASAALRKQK